MARRARFSILAALDRAAGVQAGTVTIHRDAGVFEVRPRGRRRTYTLPLGFVATLAVRHVLRIEAAEAAATKKKARRVRRGLL